MTTKFVHHICIQTNCYEESLRFYRDALGFELVQESPNFHNRAFNSWLKLEGFYIEMQTNKVGEILNATDSHSKGIVHFCLWVENLEREVELMKRNGYSFLVKNGKEIYHVENGRLCKIMAPEGTIIELRDNVGI